MIYKREEYIKEDREDEKFPVKRIEVLDPVGEGAAQYVGQVALGMQTPMGVQQIPVSFQIEAEDIEQAFDKFVETAEPRIEEARKQVEEQIQKARQQAQNRIVTPDQAGLQNQGNVIDFDKLKTDE